jgi:predicted O-linked N-acetylglucosamine transferase (SPINDLY family)
MSPKDAANQHDESDLTQQIIALFSSGRYADALPLTDRLTSMQPRNGFGWKARGTVLQMVGRPEDAIHSLQRATALLPHDAEAHSNLGHALCQTARYREAESACRRAIALAPGSAHAHLNLGSALRALQRPEEAVASLAQAVKLQPGLARAWNLMGLTWLESGHYARAVETYQQAVQVHPDAPGLHLNLAIALQEMGRLTEAETSARDCLRLDPNSSAAPNVLGNIMRGLGKLDAATGYFRQAISLAPDFYEALSNLGNALYDLGRLEEAIQSYRQALDIKPDDAEVLSNLGNALIGCGHHAEARHCLERALSISPDLPQTWANLASAFHETGLMDDALTCYQRSLDLAPSAACHSNFGNALRDLGRLAEAETQYRQALRLKPTMADTWSNLGNVLRDTERSDDAEHCYRRAIELAPGLASARSNLLFSMAHAGRVSPGDYRHAAEQWERHMLTETERTVAQKRHHAYPPRSGGRLRVGYVSGDFRQHAVSYFLEPILRHHDRDRVEIFAYETSGRRDAVTNRLHGLTGHWRELAGVPDDNAVRLIESDRIDVLVDLSGHTAFGRLGIFARRAAPVQAHYLGYFATTGLSQMDYLIADETTIPLWMDTQFTERIWRLPRCRMCYQADETLDYPSPQRGADGTIWLGSFNHLNKLTQETLTLWKRVLDALPTAKLMLKAKGLEDEENRKQLLARLDALGIGQDQVRLRGTTSGWHEHMATYGAIDIALDPVGAHGGATTTCDALWMGAPVITCAGGSMKERMTASLLEALGRPEWIAASFDDYVSRVVDLALNDDRRTTLRADQRIRMRSSALCDANGLARALEHAFEAMRFGTPGAPPVF